MFDAADWLPTLLDASGLNGNGPSPNGLSLDGVSQWGELMDRRVPHARNMTLLNHWDNPTGGDGLRLDSANWRWKLIRGNVAFEGGDNTPNWFSSSNCEADVHDATYPCCCAPNTTKPGNLMSVSPDSTALFDTSLNALQDVGSAVDDVCPSDTAIAEGICRAGNDLVHGGVSATSWQECCSLCTTNSSCVAWTYNQDAASRCFLKSEPTPGSAGDSCVSSPDNSRSCAAEDTDAAVGICRPGDDLVEGGVAAGSWQECCSTCSMATGCEAWTFNTGSKPTPCYLKSGYTESTSDVNCISSPDVPVPMLLFDVLSDPGETTDLSSVYPDVAEMMSAMIDSLLESQVPEGPPANSSCPVFSWVLDPLVGDTWAPWC